ncbi:MAG: hypothetical protein COZ56_17775 [Armatimonadetes bacterium CG_4_8_14_3_um_filter_58_9]|nr:MAG: hypothetical protein COZ56_17775 [Armatimonadetes bacterium CG_4_8_14_3_um_filter_58_9]
MRQYRRPDNPISWPASGHESTPIPYPDGSRPPDDADATERKIWACKRLGAFLARTGPDKFSCELLNGAVFGQAMAEDPIAKLAIQEAYREAKGAVREERRTESDVVESNGQGAVPEKAGQIPGGTGDMPAVESSASNDDRPGVEVAPGGGGAEPPESARRASPPRVDLGDLEWPE